LGRISFPKRVLRDADQHETRLKKRARPKKLRHRPDRDPRVPSAPKKGKGPVAPGGRNEGAGKGTSMGSSLEKDVGALQKKKKRAADAVGSTKRALRQGGSSKTKGGEHRTTEHPPSWESSSVTSRPTREDLHKRAPKPASKERKEGAFHEGSWSSHQKLSSSEKGKAVVKKKYPKIIH